SNKILKLKAKDLLYNIATNRIVLRKRLQRWRPDIPSHCFGCIQDETASHLFFHCRHVERLWKWVTDRWKDATGKVVTISEKKIISGFPFGSRKAKKDGRTIVWVNLCVEVLWSIWSERNRCAFDNGTFCYNTLLNILKFNI